MNMKIPTVKTVPAINTTALLQDAPCGDANDRGFEINRIYLAIEADKFFELLLGKAIRMSDFHCLDALSKQRVWQWYLEACCRR